LSTTAIHHARYSASAVVRIFLSTEWSADERVIEIIARLKSHPNIQLDQSPLNPMLGDDPRWHDWYGRGYGEVIAKSDCFVAVVTPGYDSSTWMAHEFDEALKLYQAHGRPRLFVAKADSQPLPLGFKPYEEVSMLLLGTPEAAVTELLAQVRAGSDQSRDRVRGYKELLCVDPAWPELEAAARKSRRVTILPRDAEAARFCLEKLQVTTRSSLGALAHETGGLLVEEHGWLRVFGCGHQRLPRALGQWNETLGVPISDFLLIADDVVGGAFAVNGGALGPALGNVFYFAPERLTWEDMHVSHGAFVRWIFGGDVESFYENLRWPGWENEMKHVGGDQALSLYPPPWTTEGKDVSQVSRRAIPAREVWALQQDLARQLGAPARTSS
jgi:hypothetical protein